MSDPITVEMLADKCNMNRDTFIRKFTKIMGITPYAYLKNLRLRTAKILKRNGLPLSEIASLTGYSDSTSLLHALNTHKG
jgi:transcriptional regulator GlxA family with amidase domain